MNLPFSNTLPIQYLAAVFNETTNSYKFYWFLSILNSIKKQKTERVILDDLILEMIVNVWYPINYFRISFGKQDQFAKKIEAIKKVFELQGEVTKDELFNLFMESKDRGDIKIIVKELARFVPYRFLTPWFSAELSGKKDSQKDKLITEYAKKYFAHNKIKPLYKFSDKRNIIELDSDWCDYLTEHLKILEGFTLWNLSVYLRKHNPNVPNIQDKLFAPITRDLSIAQKFWKNYLINMTDAHCIYSDEPFELSNITIDHFLPWRFVTHDQLWNLIPVSKSINSAKSDNIPSEVYLNNFSKLQFNAFHFSLESNIMQSKVLEDYAILFKDTINNITGISRQKFEEVLTKSIKPLMQIAINMGFNGNWIYEK